MFFLQLRQLRRVRCLLDTDSTVTPIHTYVYKFLFAGAPKVWTDKFQRMQRHVFQTETNKYDPGLAEILHNDLYWLYVPEKIKFNLHLTVFKCLHGMALQHLLEPCFPIAKIDGRHWLRSAARGQLVIPRTKLQLTASEPLHALGRLHGTRFLSWLKDA